MLERYRPAFEAMDPEAAAHVWRAVLDRHPGRIPHLDARDVGNVTGALLFESAHQAGLYQAEVVMSVAHQDHPLAVRALEAVVGHKLRPPPPEPSEEDSETPARTRRTVSDPRVVISVEPNPRREGSAAAEGYSHWTVGKTVDECIAAGLPARYVTKDTKLNRVVLGPPGTVVKSE